VCEGVCVEEKVRKRERERERSRFFSNKQLDKDIRVQIRVNPLKAVSFLLPSSDGS
jgi:ribosomal protein L16/L10AE